MSCTNCGTNHNGLPAGCRNNGACGTYGCNKLDVFDWLAGMALPDGQKPFDIAEVRFKASRKGFYRIPSDLELHPGDVVAVESSPGHDVGIVSLTGELVRMQMKHKGVKDNYEIKKIYRKARPEDITRWQEARQAEQGTMMRARELANELRLNMKLSDVEYQGDRTKATFYYTADDRVDFRELIKRYAEEFRVKVEMRQIGLRVEAQRVGGIGSCGRELCCSSWLTDFRSVSTSAARYQQLSLNPSKLAGQCGKLKCCLNYELDQYLEALRDIPPPNTRLQLAQGTAQHIKTDIFQRLMYFSIEGVENQSIVALSVDAVKEILDMNRSGQRPEDVSAYIAVEEPDEEISFANVVGQDSLTRFDSRGRGKKKGGQSRRGNKGRPSGEGRSTDKPQPNSRNSANRSNPQGGARPAGKERQPRQSRPNDSRQQGRGRQKPQHRNRPDGGDPAKPKGPAEP